MSHNDTIPAKKRGANAIVFVWMETEQNPSGDSPLGLTDATYVSNICSFEIS